MRSLRSTLALAVASLLAAAPLAAQEVVDQNQPTAATGFVGMDFHVGQTFVQSGANISGVGIFLKSLYNTSVSQNLQFTVYDAVPSSTTSPNVIASGTEATTLSPGGTGWIDFHFSPYAISPGTALFLMVTGGLNGVQATSAINVGGTFYAAGQAYSSTDGINYLAHPQEDLTFRTYTTLQQPVLTPEPASLVLLATGLIGVGSFARRRRTA